ncbi:serine hydrolase domain-containing protein [Microtetraspora fusca]|uniref:Serine hydrolase domain-containing protein n=1 Tax=Microtetraspora fusca TaxID=1997 RepID=A0ABW6VAT3_MICFU
MPKVGEHPPDLDRADAERRDSIAMKDMLTKAARRLGVTGAQAAVIAGGELRVAATGTANAELGIPMDPRTLIQIGSTTKLHTAVLVMTLVDEGLVDLDAPVRRYLPELRLADEEAARSVTPRHLLSMTSGIDNGRYDGDHDDPLGYLSTFADMDMLFAPGNGYSYSNASTVVSGALVARMTGLSWDEALRRRVFEPLGLRDRLTLWEELPYHRIAVGHAPDGSVVRPWALARGSGPAGSTLCSTAADLARFGELFLRDGGGVLSPGACAAMQVPQVALPTRRFADEWCLGPYRRDFSGLEVFGHSGTNLGGSSTLLWAPSTGTVVAVVCNTPHAGYPLAAEVAAYVLGSAPADVEPVTRRTADPGRYEGRYAACDLRYDVTSADGVLTVTLEEAATGRTSPPVALLPLDGDRFLPEVDLSGGRGWDLAFVVEDGTAVRLVSGAFAARRVR